jgi:hypothetical protein
VIGSASPPLVTLSFFKPCTLVECIRHELLEGGEELRVVSHLPRDGVDPGGLKDPLKKMATKQRLKVRHKAASQVLPIGKCLMVRKQGRDEIDILDIGLALTCQHVGPVHYERKLRQDQNTIALKVPPIEVPVEFALAIVEDYAASSMLVASSEKVVVRSSRL